MVQLLTTIETDARARNIPIMQASGIAYLTNYIKEHQITSILEIGTAIGYSAIKMALVSKDIKLISIERNEALFNEAIANINRFKLHDQITLVLSDAFDTAFNETFDLIFIDAAKAQNEKLFLKFQANLKPHGVIITDNLNFHGLTHTKEPITSKNLRSLVNKIRAYEQFLKENESFTTTFVDVGDGLAISVKK